MSATKLQPKPETLASFLPEQETLWHRLSLYTTPMERDRFLFRACDALGTTYLSLTAAMKRKTAGRFNADELQAMATATGTDMADLLDKRLFLVASQSGGYCFLEAEDIVSSVNTEGQQEAA